MKIEIGMPYRFRPAAFMASREIGIWQTPEVSGRIIYINREHGYFIAEANVNGRALREGFPCALTSRIANRVKVRHGYRH